MSEVEGIILPQKVVAEDRSLEKAAEGSAEALMKLRWHWTLDESNPKRVSLRAYAKAVGKNLKTIQQSANGFAIYLKRGDGSTPVTASGARDLALMGSDTAAATEAVAKARGVSVTSARQHHKGEVAAVKAVAQDRAERKQIPVEDSVDEIARHIVTHAKRTETEKSKGKNRPNHVVLQAAVARVQLAMVACLKVFMEAQVDPEVWDEIDLDTSRQIFTAMEQYVRGRNPKLSEPLLRLVKGA